MRQILKNKTNWTHINKVQIILLTILIKLICCDASNQQPNTHHTQQQQQQQSTGVVAASNNNQKQQQLQYQQQNYKNGAGDPQHQYLSHNDGHHLTNTADFHNQVTDRGHVMEHLEGMADTRGRHFTDDEIIFHYFKLHDYDNNNKLDGREIIAAITHQHKEDSHHHPAAGPVTPLMDEELRNLVDAILHDDDKNDDGYVDYYEFASAQHRNRQRAAAAAAATSGGAPGGRRYN